MEEFSNGKKFDYIKMKYCLKETLLLKKENYKKLLNVCKKQNLYPSYSYKSSTNSLVKICKGHEKSVHKSI